MRAIDFITESRSADLFHGTSLAKLHRILADDVLVANTPIHSTNIPQKFKGYTKTVSLSRSPTVATNFARSSAVNAGLGSDSIPVVLVIDEALLYRDIGRRMQPYDDMDSLSAVGDNPRSRGTSEAEEVVFGSIANINKYIKKIIVNLPSTPAAIAELKKYSKIASDPRTAIVDILGKVHTPRQFMDLYAGKRK